MLAGLRAFLHVLGENPFPFILESLNPPLQLLEATGIPWLKAFLLHGQRQQEWVDSFPHGITLTSSSDPLFHF